MMKGFTLVEVVLVVLLLSILGTITFTNLADQTDSRRYEETRAKMEAIRVAILGDDSVDEQGSRTKFGYLGDMGRLPVTLDSLVTQGSQPTYAFDTFYGFGSGWRGPYISEQFTAGASVSVDGWGNNFTYATNGLLSITSQGADKAAGGVVYDKDIVLQVPQNRYLSTVQGIVANGAIRIGTATVEIRYPVNGTQTAVTNSTTQSGFFVFSTVPYGPRSLQVTGPSPVASLGPKKIIVDSQATMVPEHTLDYAGELISFTSGVAGGGGNLTVTVTFNSAYRGNIALDYIISTHSTANTITSFNVNGGVAETIPNIASGVKLKPRTTYNIVPGANTFTIVYSGDMATGTINHFLTIVFRIVTQKATFQFTT